MKRLITGILACLTLMSTNLNVGAIRKENVVKNIAFGASCMLLAGSIEYCFIKNKINKIEKEHENEISDYKSKIDVCKRLVCTYKNERDFYEDVFTKVKTTFDPNFKSFANTYVSGAKF